MDKDTDAPPPLPPMPVPLADVYEQRRGPPGPPAGAAKAMPAHHTTAPAAAPGELDELRTAVAELRADLLSALGRALGGGELDDVHAQLTDLLAQQATTQDIVQAQDTRIDELATIVAELRDELGEVD